MIKSPFILGAHHLSVEEWQALFREISSDLESIILSTTDSRFVYKKKLAERINNLNFFIQALPTILKEG